MRPLRLLVVLLSLLLLSACNAGPSPGITLPGFLSSGTTIVLQAFPQRDAAGAVLPPRPADLAAARVVLTARLALLGLGGTHGLGTVVQVPDTDQLEVRLPGDVDVQRIGPLLAATGRLELVDSGHGPLTLGTLICTTNSCPEALVPLRGGSTPAPTPLLARKIYSVIIDSHQVDRSLVQVTRNSNNIFTISFTLMGDGPQILADFSGSHMGSYWSITLDGTVLRNSVIQGKVVNGRLVVESLLQQEAEDLVAQLKSGPLPLPLAVVAVAPFGTTPTPAK